MDLSTFYADPEGWTGDLEQVIRAADEGMPVAALKRIFRLPDLFLRETLHNAIDQGKLVAMPREDWPPLVPRDYRLPLEPRVAANDNDNRSMLLRFARKFKTTPMEGSVLLVLLRRQSATRQQLHAATKKPERAEEETDIKIVDVAICKLRKKIGPHGIVIHTLHSMGYQISEGDRQKAWALTMEVDHAGTVPPRVSDLGSSVQRAA